MPTLCTINWSIATERFIASASPEDFRKDFQKWKSPNPTICHTMTKSVLHQPLGWQGYCSKFWSTKIIRMAEWLKHVFKRRTRGAINESLIVVNRITFLETGWLGGNYFNCYLNIFGCKGQLYNTLNGLQFALFFIDSNQFRKLNQQ